MAKTVKNERFVKKLLYTDQKVENAYNDAIKGLRNLTKLIGEDSTLEILADQIRELTEMKDDFRTANVMRIKQTWTVGENGAVGWVDAKYTYK
jgi:hypothetical protein